jgi:hypothetical protein
MKANSYLMTAPVRYPNPSIEILHYTVPHYAAKDPALA